MDNAYPPAELKAQQTAAAVAMQPAKPLVGLEILE